MTHQDSDPGAHDGPATGADRLEEQEEESFPASDPHSDWSGPPEPEIDREDEAGP